MKDFLSKIARSTCTTFTAIMGVWCVAGLAFAGAQYGIVLTLTLLAASLALAALRALWFTDRLITRLAYPVRIFGFGVTAFASLALCAWAGQWMPTNNPGAWVTFTVLFLIILTACCVAYQIYFKRTAGSFDAALRSYHEKAGR